MIEIHSGKMKVAVSGTLWTMTLELARLCGWEPKGTVRQCAGINGEPTADSELQALIPWQADYASNDSQIVRDDDARALAEGLARAAVDGHRILNDWQAGKTTLAAPIYTPAGGFRWFFTREGREHLLALSILFRRGQFQIC